MTARTGSQGGVRVVGAIASSARLRAALWRGVAAALLVLCAAGCSETTSSNASPDGLRPIRRRPSRSSSIDGPPVGVFNRLVDNLSPRQAAPAGDRRARAPQLPRARLSGGAGRPRPHAYRLGVGRLRRRQAAHAAHRRRGSRRPRAAPTPGASPTRRCCAGSPAPAWNGSRSSWQSRRAGRGPATAVADAPEPAPPAAVPARRRGRRAAAERSPTLGSPIDHFGTPS